MVEIASNDGYLLQYFVERGVPVLGIEPAANVAEAASERGIPTRVDFFGAATAAARCEAKGFAADLVLGNNVLAHVPGPERLRRRRADRSSSPTASSPSSSRTCCG